MFAGRIPIDKDEIGNRNNSNNIMFAIMCKLELDNDNFIEIGDYDNFIGTISLNNIDWINRSGETGYMIGNKEYWGGGIATEAVKLISEYALNRLNLHKVEAGVVEGNIGSVKVLEKNGFREYGIIPDDYFYNGKFYATHRFYKLQEKQGE